MKKALFGLSLAIALTITTACGTTEPSETEPQKESTEEVAESETTGDSEDTLDAAEEEVEEVEEIEEEEVVYEPIELIELNGTGDTATEFFNLSGEFATIELKHSGSRNFIVRMKDASGMENESLANDIGNYEGKTFLFLSNTGEHLLDVKADGDWSVIIDQNIPDEITNEPVSLSGSGDDVIFVHLKSGLKRFELKHNGERNFIVRVNDEFSLVNEIGKYEGSTTETVADEAIYAISVKADGEWSINIE
ncbi:hypothetical protein AB3N04_12945 [Alkalihalophilus sp. As8PL]|uniref:Lipoprotein n=1 Tax=Alkalihalophilus sp. As8PL TaxID=3237103 RepID=A0AB39BP60_9BACI